MSLSDDVTLPCGIVLPNRLAKAAMAELLSTSHNPDQQFLKAYGEWATGGWGMILTGNVMVSNKHHGSPRDVEVNHSTTSDGTEKQWKDWATVCKSGGAKVLAQLCHPGRQSGPGSGRRWFFEKTIAPSAVGLSLGPGWLMWIISSLVFGVPREMTTEDIHDAIEEFASSAKQVFRAGFDGVQIHGAHGYLVSQFLSPKMNLRTDDFGGTPDKRAEFLRRIIKRIKSETSPSFCVGVKINSADHQNNENPEDVMDQIQLMVNEGIDFIEISGGTYENPKMMETDASTRKESTLRREAFFLDFAHQVRQRFPKIVLMVTGGFRSREGMESAISSGDCDLIGIGRPAAVLPKLPNDIIFNKDVADKDAKFFLNKAPKPPGPFSAKVIEAGAETAFYSQQIRRLAQGQVPLFA